MDIPVFPQSGFLSNSVNNQYELLGSNIPMVHEAAGFQQEKKPHYSRHKGTELVILI